VLTNSFLSSSRWAVSFLARDGALFRSLEFMSLDGSYDMILFPPPRDSDDGERQPARRRRNRRRLPHMVEEQHLGLSRPLPRRRRKRRGNQGQAGGGTPSAVERVDGAGAPTGCTSGTDLASETKTSVVSPQHANLKRTDDASTLAKDLLGVTLVPETTVRSVPDVTSSPPVDQEVPTDSHLTPFGFSLNPPSDFASVDALIEANPNPLGYRMRSPWDRLMAVSTYGPSGSEEDDEPDFCQDFSGLGNPSAMRDFMTACDYCLSDCSDGSHSLDDEDCGPSRECFHVDLGGPDEGNHLGMPENGDLPRPVPRVDILRELAVVPVPAGGPDPQLEQIREMQARLDGGAGTLEPIRRDIGQEWVGQPPAGEARHLPQGFQHRIADDVRIRPPPTSSRVGQNLAIAAILLRVMPEPSTTKGRRIQGELKNLLEDTAVRRAESSASRRQGCPSEHRAATSRFMREASVHTGRTRYTAPAAPGRLSNEHHHRNRRAHLDERVRRGYHPRRGGRYDSGEDRSPSPEPPGPQAFSRAIGRAPFPTRFRTPTTITKYSGETRPECGSRTTGWPANWVERTMTTSSSATSPYSSPILLGPGWSTCLRGRSPTGTTWSKPSPATSRARTCALETLGISEAVTPQVLLWVSMLEFPLLPIIT
jgi:hypothetical protein